MDAQLIGDAEEFAALTAPLYRRDPVRHTIELTALAAGVRSDAVLLTVCDGATVVGAALHTPPYPLLVNGLSAETMDAAIELLTDVRPELVDVRGVRDLALRFSSAWESRLGVRGRVTLSERLYRLTDLRPPDGVPGIHRVATEIDHPVLVDRVEAFYGDAFGEPQDEVAGQRFVTGNVTAGGRFVLWVVDDEPVSMALVRGPAAGVSRIGPVHTPSDLRGRGFASAVTAAAAGLARAHGTPEVVLFADLANPVSNAIYQRIGFRPVTDFARVTFGPR